MFYISIECKENSLHLYVMLASPTSEFMNLYSVISVMIISFARMNLCYPMKCHLLFQFCDTGNICMYIFAEKNTENGIKLTEPNHMFFTDVN